MASELLQGQAVLHGIQNNGAPITVTGYATFILNKIGGKHNFNLKLLQDELDFDTAAVATNENIEVTLDFTISGGPGGNRVSAAATAQFPAPLAVITLSNIKIQTQFGTSATKIFDGNYSYRGDATIDLMNNDFTKLTGLKLVKYADPTQAALMTTTVNG
jgi:hypothetical protein